MPVSVASVMSGAIAGVVGATVSITALKLGLWADSLPAASVNVVLIVCVPSAIGLVGVRVLVAALKVADTFTPSI